MQAPTKAVLGRVKPMKNGKAAFYEILPLCSRNAVDERKSHNISGVCSEELTLLFDCLKKWEYDDLPCAKFQASYMRCIDADKKQRVVRKQASAELNSSPEFANATADAKGNPTSLSIAQFNKLMELHPHPQAGAFPYRAAKRLPTTSYAEDTYNHKGWKGKRQ